jgi:hypothetical protein
MSTFGFVDVVDVAAAATTGNDSFRAAVPRIAFIQPCTVNTPCSFAVAVVVTVAVG